MKAGHTDNRYEVTIEQAPLVPVAIIASNGKKALKGAEIYLSSDLPKKLADIGSSVPMPIRVRSVRNLGE